MITQMSGGAASFGLHLLDITLCGTSREHSFHIIHAHVKDLGMLPCGCDGTEYTRGWNENRRELCKLGVRRSNVPEDQYSVQLTSRER